MENLNSSNSYVQYTDESVVKTLMRNVYLWMTLALGITGITAWITLETGLLLALVGTPLIVLCIVELVLVFVISGRIERLSLTAATLLFIVYSIINGLTLSPILLVYTQESVVSTFFITAGMFAGMALVGTFTKKDLSTMGRILFMLLIGLLVATVVNIFLASSHMAWIISLVGVVVFTGLTAYDAQKIKNMLTMVGSEVNESTSKLALLGSLSLYLDFINLFLYLLRLFGSRRN